MNPLQKENSWHNGRRDNQPGKHDRTDNRSGAIGTALHDKGNKRREQHDQGHRPDGDERTVPQSSEHASITKLDHVADVLEQLKFARQTELEERRLGTRFRRRQ